jgi:hypothetical protein
MITFDIAVESNGKPQDNSGPPTWGGKLSLLFNMILKYDLKLFLKKTTRHVRLIQGDLWGRDHVHSLTSDEIVT